MEIVDAQVHGNQLGPDWRTAPLEDTLDTLITTMDAVGIDAVILDEYTTRDDEHHMLPGHVDSDGFWRPDRPFSELAVLRHPQRFAYLWRIDRVDPKLKERMGAVSSAPGRLGVRIQWGPDARVWHDPAFANGQYDELFAEAERNGVPIFAIISPRVDLLVPYIQRFPDLQFVIDHIGVDPLSKHESTVAKANFDRILALADFGNVAIKWSHVQRLTREPYPFEEAMPYLRRVVNAFSHERIMWASDYTVTRRADRYENPSTWAESLHYLRDSDMLSSIEKEFILGRTARTLLHWGKPTGPHL